MLRHLREVPTMDCLHLRIRRTVLSSDHRSNLTTAVCRTARKPRLLTTLLEPIAKGLRAFERMTVNGGQPRQGLAGRVPIPLPAPAEGEWLSTRELLLLPIVTQCHCMPGGRADSCSHAFVVEI